MAVLLVWVAYIGIWFDELIPGYDATAYVIDTSLLKGVNFNFKDYLYRYEILGGTQIYDIYGVPSFLHFYKLLSFLDLHPITMFNGYIIYYQLLLGYFGMKSVELFRKYFYGGKTPQSYLPILIGLIFSFLTILGLRITHGHVNPELITIPMFFVVVLGFQFNRFSLLDLFLTNFVLYTVSPPNGQLAVYTAFFPIFVYVGLSVEVFRNGDKKKLFYSLTYLIVATIAAFLIFIPELIDRLTYLKSSDTLRNLNSTRDLVYSYTTHTWKDLVSSFTFMLEPFTTRANPFLLHETNYPTSFLPLLLFLLPIRKHKILFSSFLLTTVIIFTFSMDISPFQNILLKLNPVLLGFRVPARSISIFVILSFIFCLPLVLEKIDDLNFIRKLKQEEKSIQLLAGVLLISLLFINPISRELLYFAVLMSFIYVLAKPATRISKLSYLMLPVLFCTVLSSFKERYKESYVSMGAYDSARDFGERIKSKFPELKNPMTRVTAVGDMGVFGSNFPLLIGLSTIDGYRLMHKRFITTVNGIRSMPTSTTELLVQYAPNQENYDLVSNMYNIKGLLVFDSTKNNIQMQMFERPSRPAWFVKEVLETYNIYDMIDSKNLFYERAYVLEKVDQSVPGIHANCEESKVQDMKAEFNNQNVSLKVSTAGECPLIFATNYTEKLNVYDAKSGEKLTKFPAWGSLLGVMVKKGTTDIELKAETTYPPSIEYYSMIGWIMMLLNILYAGRGLFIPLLPGHRGNRT